MIFTIFTIRKINDCENIYIVNPLYLIIGKVDGHRDCNSVEEKNENKEVFKKVHRTLEQDEIKLKQ